MPRCLRWPARARDIAWAICVARAAAHGPRRDGRALLAA